MEIFSIRDFIHIPALPDNLIHLNNLRGAIAPARPSNTRHKYLTDLEGWSTYGAEKNDLSTILSNTPVSE